LKEILTKIEQAGTNDKTIMIVAVCLHPTAKVDQTFCTYIKKLIVVAAVSYQTYPNPSNALATDVFISLMRVASSAVPHPTLIHSWRRNGIGMFLFVQVIKRCAWHELQSTDDTIRTIVSTNSNERANNRIL
jgi:hypothetical protein